MSPLHHIILNQYFTRIVPHFIHIYPKFRFGLETFGSPLVFKAKFVWFKQCLAAVD